MTKEYLISFIKFVAVAAGVAALGAAGSAVGADPVLNSDPTTAGIAGFVVTVLARLALTLAQAAGKPTPEVVPLSATLTADVPHTFDRPGGTTGTMGGL